VADGVDEGFADSEGRVFGQLFAFELVDDSADAHFFPDDVPGAFDDAGERAVDFGATAVSGAAFFTPGFGAGEFDENDAALGHECLRIEAEEEHTGDGRPSFGVNCAYLEKKGG